jgi:hypothetical protein
MQVTSKQETVYLRPKGKLQEVAQKLFLKILERFLMEK